MINKVEEEVEVSEEEELWGAKISPKDSKGSQIKMRKMETRVVEKFLEGEGPMEEEGLVD